MNIKKTLLINLIIVLTPTFTFGMKNSSIKVIKMESLPADILVEEIFQHFFISLNLESENLKNLKNILKLRGLSKKFKISIDNKYNEQLKKIKVFVIDKSNILAVDLNTTLRINKKLDKSNVIKITKLIKDGANLEFEDEFDRTPLMWSCKRGFKGAALLLIQEMINDYGDTRVKSYINLENDKGETAFIYSLKSRSKDLIKLLIDKGADLNKGDKIYGNTALMIVAKYGYEDMAKLIVNEKSVDLDLKNKIGLTASMVAEKYNNYAIKKLIDEVSSKKQLIDFD